MKTLVLLFTSTTAWAGTALPLAFEPNQGQAHASVQFLNRSVYLGSGRVAIHAGSDKPVVMDLIGARKHIHAEGRDLQPGITSYFLGNDPRKWRSGVPHYARVLYKDVYPGIDMIFYGNEAGQLEYDFVVAPGADPTRIQVAYNQPVHEDANGDLVIADVRQKRPRVSQEGHEVACRYVRTGDTVRVALSAYDHTQPLTVDPVLVFSTYLGGPALETGTGVQVDAKGNSYVSLYEQAPADPSLNPFQQSAGGSYAAFAAKLSPDGKSVIWYAFVGGTGNTYGNAIALDAAANVYLAGSTSALDFPANKGAQQQFGGGFNDAFIAKVSANGLSLLYASYIGGENEDEGQSVAVDSLGNAYVAGFTHSFQFPVKNSLQPYGGGQDGYITKVSPSGDTFVFSTYLGGSRDDYIDALALDGAGAIYATGHTTSTDFPLKNPIQSSPSQMFNPFTLFLTKLSSSGDQIVYSTYLGGAGLANGFGVGADANGNAYVCGTTTSGFAVKNAFQPSYGGGQSDVFVMKIDPTGSNVIFATYLGGSDTDFQSENALAVDQAGNVFVTGFTYSVDFPVKDSLQPFVSANTGFKTNVFVTEFSPSGSLIYSTLFGGHGDNRGAAIAVDLNDDVYVTGIVFVPDFPVLNAFQSTYGGGGDAFLFKLAPDVAPPSPFSPIPGTAQFTFVVGGSVPAAQTISIPSGGSFSITTSNAPWASTSPQSGTTPGTLTITVNPAGLAPGVYSGTIQVVPPLGTPFTLPVTLNVLAAAQIVTSISPSTVALNSGATTFTVTGSGFTSASVVEFLSSSALTTTFIDSGTLQFSLTKNFFTASGTYSVDVVAPQTAPSRPVTFMVGAPALAVQAITNAASYATAAVAPGEIISLFGTNMGPATGTGLTITAAGVVSTNLSGVQVLFDGTPAPLIYVRSDQVNAIVPYEVAGLTTQVTVVYNGQASTPLTEPVTSSAPALFTADASGKGQGTILNQNGSVNSPSNPAAGGSVVVLYGTGEGATDPSGVDGQVAGSVLPKPRLPVSVSIGGKDSQVLYAGAAPGEVAGVIQVNVRLPDGISSGSIPVVLKVGAAKSQAGVLVSVH